MTLKSSARLSASLPAWLTWVSHYEPVQLVPEAEHDTSLFASCLFSSSSSLPLPSSSSLLFPSPHFFPPSPLASLFLPPSPLASLFLPPSPLASVLLSFVFPCFLLYPSPPIPFSRGIPGGSYIPLPPPTGATSCGQTQSPHHTGGECTRGSHYSGRQ